MGSPESDGNVKASRFIFDIVKQALGGMARAVSVPSSH
tara:strand:- start:63 stop:176 length:114 start_codon:yes stop_codon:yes gene_type:complete